MTEQHLPIEDLAAYAAGDLDAPAAVAAEAHVLLCAQCRSDVEALNATAAALATVERPVMPFDVAGRLAAALAEEADDPAAALADNVVHLDPERASRSRRPSFAGIAAVAACLALVGAIVVPLVRTDGTPGLTTASDLAERGAVTETRRLASGLDYTRGTLATTLAAALKGATVAGVTAGDAAAPNVAEPSPLPSTTARALQEASGVASRDAMRFSVEPARLAACVSALAADLPENGRTPAVVDVARFAGKPAIVLAFPTVSRGQVRTDRLDVFVVAPTCGTTSDAQVLDFQRIPRPT